LLTGATVDSEKKTRAEVHTLGEKLVVGFDSEFGAHVTNEIGDSTERRIIVLELVAAILDVVRNLPDLVGSENDWMTRTNEKFLDRGPSRDTINLVDEVDDLLVAKGVHVAAVKKSSHFLLSASVRTVYFLDRVVELIGDSVDRRRFANAGATVKKDRLTGNNEAFQFLGGTSVVVKLLNGFGLVDRHVKSSTPASVETSLHPCGVAPDL
jgi:hypothetical protein